jgi:hypothetical protein
MRTSYIIQAFVFAAFAALFTGCASYNYNLAVKNVGTSEVWCSLVASSKGMAHEPGTLFPGAGKTFAGPFRVPYRDRWTVEWRTANGDVIRRDLDLSQAFPTRFEGRLVFTVDDNQRLGYFTESFSGR